MEKYKVTCIEDNKNFIVTNTFLNVKKVFKKLKNKKGIIIQVLGAPGTGKSSNIYKALEELNLNVYSPRLTLKSHKISPKKVYLELIDSMKRDFNVKTLHQLYNELSKYDAILFADQTLDSELYDGKKTGLGEWIHKNRLVSGFFYLLLIFTYLKHFKRFKKLNIIFHTTWTFHIKNIKYDLLTDFSILSLIFKSFLRIFFDVVEISYSKVETVKIIKSHYNNVNEEIIRSYIDKYGCKPRLILNALESDLKSSYLYNSALNVNYCTTKSR